MTVRHPAKFSAPILPRLAHHLAGARLALDPFAGIGGCHQLEQLVPGLTVIGLELEPEWARQAPGRMVIGNALRPPFRPDTFDAYVTSPTYGNRMADHHNARDGSVRHTYRHTLGRPLHPDNSGAMQWGPAYRDLHHQAYAAALELLAPGARLVVNVSNHYRRGAEVDVVAWHADTIAQLGATILELEPVITRRQRHGANGTLRVAAERIIVAQLP